MSPDVIATFAREALILTIQMSAPLIGSAALVGLLFGVLQSLTQLQDQTTTFALKLVVVLGLLLVLLPWLSAQLSTYGGRMFDLLVDVR